MGSITIKDLPHRLHRLLKASARRNRRSLNSELIERLEESVAPRQIDVRDLQERARQSRESLKLHITEEDINRAKRQGRR